MRLYDELFKNAEGMALERYVVVVGGGGYFEGVKSLGDFSPERVCIFYPRACVEVTGTRLRIAKYCDGDLRLDGEITSVSLLKGGK